MSKKFLPLYISAKIIKIDRDFPKLWSQMYCHLFYGSQCIRLRWLLFYTLCNRWLQVQGHGLAAYHSEIAYLARKLCISHWITNNAYAVALSGQNNFWAVIRKSVPLSLNLSKAKTSVDVNYVKLRIDAGPRIQARSLIYLYWYRSRGLLFEVLR